MIPLITRPMAQHYVPACTALLNHTIALGGTTAYEAPYTETGFSDHYLHEKEVIVVALDGDRLVGFQGTFLDGAGTLSIGSFADQRDPVKGVGRALFAKTCELARAQGFHTILAKITEDNTPGLGFYSAMGFKDWKTIPNDAMRAGKPIARVITRFEL